MSKKQSHLEMIQGVINRLSYNSFLLKGWSVVLISALFALGAENGNKQFIVLAYFPAVVFWGLDAYFLRQERMFRALYNLVRVKDENEIDFSMDLTETQNIVPSWSHTAFSLTILFFHGVIFGTIIFLMIILKGTNGGWT